MIQYYREPNGDYLAVNTDTADYYRQHLGVEQMEGRATAIAGEVESVCTTAIGRAFLRGERLTPPCSRVAKRNGPKEWRDAIGYD